MARYHFFAFLSRMKYIRRWGLMRNTVLENIAEHSLQTAMIAGALANIRNVYFGGKINTDRVTALAIYHDCSEVITGDLPTPVKYANPYIMEQYKEIEVKANQKLLSMLPIELRKCYEPMLMPEETEKEEWNLVKAADKLCAYIKCKEEILSGNKEFAKAALSIEKSLLENPLSEVHYFMEHFLESFSLTLDEQD